MQYKRSDITPVTTNCTYPMKRDDLFTFNGVCGGKVRTCLKLASACSADGIVTACSRMSPQGPIVARVAEQLGMKARIHMPTGDETNEMNDAKNHGAELVQHFPGHNSVIACRAKEDAKERYWGLIPFGMECIEAVIETANQVGNLPWGTFSRIVVCVGSGMTLAGILQGVLDNLQNQQVSILGVIVGADPIRRLDRYAPFGWSSMCELQRSTLGYQEKDWDHMIFDGIRLDVGYEAKCVPFLREGDLFWIVGRRTNG